MTAHQEDGMSTPKPQKFVMSDAEFMETFLYYVPHWTAEDLTRVLEARDARVRAEGQANVLLALAHRAEAVIHHGEAAEVAAPVEGESGRQAAIDARDSIHEEPCAWIRGQVVRLDEILDAYESYEAPEGTQP